MRRLLFPTVGILFIIIALGTAHLYASNRVNKTLVQTIQETKIEHINMVNKLRNPAREIYRVALRVENPTFNEVEISLTGFKVSIDEFSFSLSPTNTWEETINSRHSNVFKGDFTIYSATLSELRGREEVTFNLEGDIEASTNYLWVEKTLEHNLDQEMKMIFD